MCVCVCAPACMHARARVCVKCLFHFSHTFQSRDLQTFRTLGGCWQEFGGLRATLWPWLSLG